MKTAPIRYDFCGDAAVCSAGLASEGSSLQKSEARLAGWMIPVTTNSTGPAFSRLPTRSPNSAAVALVTAACSTACCPATEPPTGSCPATMRLYRASAVR